MALAVVMTLSACDTLQGKQDPGPNTQYYINQALAGMALDDYFFAEKSINTALERDPRNPTILLIAGGVYQRTGQLQKALDAYRAAATLPGSAVISGDMWGMKGVYQVQAVAQHALMELNGGKPAVVSTMADNPAVMRGVTYNQADRFKILKALRDENLITPREYAEREHVKLPASLKDPVPRQEDVSDRLRQLSAAYASRNLPAEQYAAEREEILDRLVPRGAMTRGTVETATQKAAAQEKAAETAKAEKAAEEEKKAAEEAQTEKAAEAAKPVEASGDGAVPNPVAVVKSGREPLKIVPYEGDEAQNAENHPEAVLPAANVAVHLASFRTRDAAMRGWQMLSKKFPELAKMEPQISTLTLPDKGTFFRLNAGPLQSVDEAKALCGKLTDQFCEPVFMGG